MLKKCSICELNYYDSEKSTCCPICEEKIIKGLKDSDKIVRHSWTTNQCNLLDLFIKYLVDRGYKYLTPAGLPSTAYKYCDAVEKVMSIEKYTSINDVIKNIDNLLIEYGEYGLKSKYGSRGHNTVISALKRFSEFIEFFHL